LLPAINELKIIIIFAQLSHCEASRLGKSTTLATSTSIENYRAACGISIMEWAFPVEKKSELRTAHPQGVECPTPPSAGDDREL